MCKITALDVGMCLPKYFVIIINQLTLLLGAIIVGTSIFGVFAARSMLANDNLDIVFYAPIVFGAIIIIVSLFGCGGACLRNRCMLMTYAILVLVVFVCELVVAYFGYEESSKINSRMEDTLMDTLKQAKNNQNYLQVWDLIQHTFECCGVNSLNDWKGITDSLPMSCCPTKNETDVSIVTFDNAVCSESNAFENGCKSYVTDYLNNLSKPVLIGVVVILGIQLLNVVFSCCMYCVYGQKSNRKMNYRQPTESTETIQTE